MSEILEETIESIERIQLFDVKTLPRIEELGQEINFINAVEPAKKVIELYKRLSLDALSDFPETELTKIKNDSNAIYSYFDEISNFSISGQASPETLKQQIITKIGNKYAPTFSLLFPIISYSASRTTDSQLIETEARGIFQSVKDDANDIQNQLLETKKESENILKDVRDTAAEQGVTQQAVYYKDEFLIHEKQAKSWFKWTIGSAIILIFVSFSFMFLHKLFPGLKPTDKYEALQLLTSKIFIFSTISYFLFLSGKNFLSHKHNAVLNKHRQNSLLTYKTIVDASGTAEGKEIILSHAAYSMFSHQETGYIKVVPSESSIQNIMESIPKSFTSGLTK